MSRQPILTGTVTTVTVVDEQTRISNYVADETTSTAWMAMYELAAKTTPKTVLKATATQIVMDSMNGIVILTGTFEKS